MNICDVLTADDLIIGLKAKSKNQVLGEISRQICARHPELPEPRVVMDQLLERERLGATSIGNGIAIPHARCPMTPSATAKAPTILVTLDKPIPYDAADDLAVDIIFMLIASAEVGTQHLTALALASRTLCRPQVLQNLRAAKDAHEAWTALSQLPQTNAA